MQIVLHVSSVTLNPKSETFLRPSNIHFVVIHIQRYTLVSTLSALEPEAYSPNLPWQNGGNGPYSLHEMSVIVMFGLPVNIWADALATFVYF